MAINRLGVIQDLYINDHKSIRRVTGVHFLGFNISGDDTKPSQTLISTIRNILPPQDWKVLWHFIDVINYYRRLIPLLFASPGCSSWRVCLISCVSTCLCFFKLKVSKSSTLKPFWLNMETTLVVDASGTADARVLSLVFASHSFTPAEQKWSNVKCASELIEYVKPQWKSLNRGHPN